MVRDTVPLQCHTMYHVRAYIFVLLHYRYLCIRQSCANSYIHRFTLQTPSFSDFKERKAIGVCYLNRQPFLELGCVMPSQAMKGSHVNDYHSKVKDGVLDSGGCLLRTRWIAYGLVVHLSVEGKANFSNIMR